MQRPDPPAARVTQSPDSADNKQATSKGESDEMYLSRSRDVLPVPPVRLEEEVTAAYARVPGGTLPARRLDTWDATVHGAVYRNEWGPKQEGEAGHWWVVSPVLDTARLGPEFTVTEHGDGTISVYPSLVFERPGQSGFHGYLNRSVWSWGEFGDRRYGDAA